MSEPSFFDSLLRYEPIIDRRRSVNALRVHAHAAAQPAPCLSAVYEEISREWPVLSPTILLSAPQSALDEQILRAVPKQNVWLEVPAESTHLPEIQEILTGLSRRGFSLVLSGRPLVPLAPAMLSVFRMSIIHVDDDRRLHGLARGVPAGMRRSIGYAQDGVNSIGQMERCFDSGACAVLGWPMEDAVGYRERPSAAPDYVTIMQLITMVDQCEQSARMEAVMRRDPAIGYRLLRYINSSASGFGVKVQSFRHAFAVLGYPKLKRCLALLLASSSRDANMRPVMLASFRRGLLLEQLLAPAHDQAARDQIFILGVLSLLDKLMKKPFEELFGTLAVPDLVRQALVHRSGRFMPYLRIAEAVENGADTALAAALQECAQTLPGCNRAVLRTLQAQELQQG